MLTILVELLKECSINSSLVGLERITHYFHGSFLFSCSFIHVFFSLPPLTALIYHWPRRATPNRASPDSARNCHHRPRHATPGSPCPASAGLASPAPTGPATTAHRGRPTQLRSCALPTVSPTRLWKKGVLFSPHDREKLRDQWQIWPFQ
jgi:hypothetical protein